MRVEVREEMKDLIPYVTFNGEVLKNSEVFLLGRNTKVRVTKRREVLSPK